LHRPESEAALVVCNYEGLAKLPQFDPHYKKNEVKMATALCMLSIDMLLLLMMMMMMLLLLLL
jgi:hypothetical protein